LARLYRAWPHWMGMTSSSVPWMISRGRWILGTNKWLGYTSNAAGHLHHTQSGQRAGHCTATCICRAKTLVEGSLPDIYDNGDIGSNNIISIAVCQGGRSTASPLGVHVKCSRPPAPHTCGHMQYSEPNVALSQQVCTLHRDSSPNVRTIHKIY
jgi:hypothetical protein